MSRLTAVCEGRRGEMERLSKKEKKRNNSCTWTTVWLPLGGWEVGEMQECTEVISGDGDLT